MRRRSWRNRSYGAVGNLLEATGGNNALRCEGIERVPSFSQNGGKFVNWNSQTAEAYCEEEFLPASSPVPALPVYENVVCCNAPTLINLTRGIIVA
ncbi:hypothetical protein R1flu_006179 [Riccia fluitans]|uniref:Uncharacterized protein n=1 Tax=Riccia fluitans TaxID=41844 RepID=A0ABD1YVB1_9MARC